MVCSVNGTITSAVTRRSKATLGTYITTVNAQIRMHVHAIVVSRIFGNAG